MHSLRFRLVAASLLLLTLGLGISTAVIYLRLQSSLYGWIDSGLVSRAGDVEDRIRMDHHRIRVPQLPGEPTEEGSEGSPDAASKAETYVRVWNGDRDFQLVDAAPSMPGPEQIRSVLRIFSQRVRRKESRCFEFVTIGRTFRVLLLGAPVNRSAVGTVEVGISLSTVNESLARLRSATYLIIPLALVVAGCAGWILLGKLLGPLDQLTRQAAHLEPSDLHRGIELPRTGDEVERLARVLDSTLRRLGESFLREQQFASDAAHELRTPLAVMQSEIDVALAEDSSPETLRAALLTSKSQVQRMHSLAHSLLSLARLDTRAVTLEADDIDLRRLIETVTESLEPLAEARGVRVFTGDLAPLTVVGDEARLIQILTNLAQNAILYTSSGGEVVVRLYQRCMNALPDPSRNEKSERLAVASRTVEAVCEVRDTGVGISPDDLHRIFDRFYRADRSRRREDGSANEGAGLGLSIARRLAELHGGRIEIDSALGKGTSARLILPIRGERAARHEMV